MRKWKKIYEFENGDCAVYDGKELMLQQYPNLITVINEELKQEVFKWLLDNEYKKGEEVV
ncbi:hypothetical protein CO121_00445 [bacterium (Candidatus Gribaldobacteria) CG_4_9_14_3_um_filter_36_15]|uniref:Uncharacterized protein n=2 Tax=Candidatus Gribaldobacteria TaxID=2798536 RepID=A0A2M7VKZ1_9BACT|nr:MAG: hypothetical protein COX73_00785 [bacterium (Candidatus Gribaldobacteria) CG_4_10_14_0_2_um_filter_36_18]PJB09348.1 MAG: hypothetical protein CO121_00445 [bacterium (Candidatus Gribaldobacteria) CG_4_9_14_3_um_filter_36_15]